MARGTTQEERREAATVVLAGESIPLDDVEAAFEQWRMDTDQGEQPGSVRAWEIPLDDHGVPQPSAKNQIRLGSWPIDAYHFDDLCAMLIRDFMPDRRIMAVRLLGTKPGQGGLQFNKVVILRAPANTAANGEAPRSESVSTLMRTIQESNERTLAMLRQMTPQTPAKDVMEELQKMMVFAKMMNEPMQLLMTQLLPVLAGRPVGGGADPFGQLSSLVDVVGKVRDLGGGGESGGDSDSFASILKAAAPIIVPALTALPALIRQRPPQPIRPALTVTPTPAPGSAPTPPPVVPSPPAGSVTDIPSGDMQVFAQFKPQIDTLVQMAEQGSDPAGAADLLFDTFLTPLPDDTYTIVVDLVTNDAFVANAGILNPKVAQFAEWFAKFRAQVDKRATEEDAAAGQAPSNPQNMV